MGHHVSARTVQGKEEEGGTFVGMLFVFTSKNYTCSGPACLEVDEYLPANGKQRNNSLFPLA